MYEFMPKLSSLTTCILLVISFILFQIVVYAKIVDRIIAYVNDDLITEYELDKVVKDRCLELQLIYRFSPAEARRKAESECSELLDKMIRQMLLVHEAMKRNIQITDAEIEQDINESKKKAGIESNEEFKKQLEADGYTLISFREQTKKKLMAQRLTLLAILPKINVTDSEITEFFNENREKFASKSDRVRLSHIFIKFSDNSDSKEAARQKIKQVLEKLDSGIDFVELASKYSDDVETRSQGGDLGFKSVAELKPDIRDEIQSLKEGEYTKPIETELGIHIFKLEEREIPRLTQEEKEQIKDYLRDLKFQKEWEKFTNRLKEKAFIKIIPIADFGLRISD